MLEERREEGVRLAERRKEGWERRRRMEGKRQRSRPGPLAEIRCAQPLAVHRRGTFAFAVFNKGMPRLPTFFSFGAAVAQRRELNRSEEEHFTADGWNHDQSCGTRRRCTLASCRCSPRSPLTRTNSCRRHLRRRCIPRFRVPLAG